MARYGTFKYSEAKYGTAPAIDLLLWTFVVAWDGTYTGDNEALRMVDLQVTRGRDNMLASNGQGFEHFQPGKVIAVLDNEDGRYDPWNTESPLYPNVRPGKFTRILVKDGNTGTNYGVMRGVIDDIQPLMRNGVPHARITIKDALSWLRGKFVDTMVVTDDEMFYAVEQILNDHNTQWPIAEWPWSVGAVATTMDRYIYDYWWTWRQDAMEAIHQLEETEIGNLFHDREGVIKWRNRDYGYDRTKDVQQHVVLRDITIPQPWENIRNDVRIFINRHIQLTPPAETLWYLDEPVALADGEYYDVWALFKWDNQVVATDAVALNFEVNDQENGLGADLTGDCTIERIETEPATGAAEFSEGVGLRVTNNSGSNGYIIYLECVAQPIYIPYVGSSQARDETSAAEYGGRTFSTNSRWTANYKDKVPEAIAAWLLECLKGPIPSPIIQFESRPEYQFYLDLWDRIRLLVGKYGIYRNYRVEKIEHRWLNENGLAVRTLMKLEPYMQMGGVDEKIFVGCLLSTTAAKTISNNAWTGLDFNQELSDPWGFHSGSDDHIVIPSGFDGYYKIVGMWAWDGPALLGYVRLRLLLNGTAIANTIQEIPANGEITQTVGISIRLAAGDVLSMEGLQNTGDNLNMLHSDAPYYPLLGLYQLEAGR